METLNGAVYENKRSVSRLVHTVHTSDETKLKITVVEMVESYTVLLWKQN